MPAPTTATEFLELLRKSKLVEAERFEESVSKLQNEGLPASPAQMAQVCFREGLVTQFQAEQLLQGKWRRFSLGKYQVLEKLGSGGMGQVYLCEHKLMRRRVAVKVLPTSKATDPASLARFYREARAVAALDHPNIVRAYDIDNDDKLHFLVMEHVDGSSLQQIIKNNGPLDPTRAAHYIRQSALGLQHAHEKAGLVHRDIKPGNILVDRNGIVKVLDMGLARFFHDEDDDITKKYDENVLGTADYLAPEQALESHAADIRADIYSLGGTFYFCLVGQPPFGEGSVAQKLIWHQTRQPKPITTFRDDVPAGMVQVLEKMMAKNREDRYSTPTELAEALSEWTQVPIGPPPQTEMPVLSPALRAMPSFSDIRLAGEGVPSTASSHTGQSSWEIATPASPSSAATKPSIQPTSEQPSSAVVSQPPAVKAPPPLPTPPPTPRDPQASPPQSSPAQVAQLPSEDSSALSETPRATSDTADPTSRQDTPASGREPKPPLTPPAVKPQKQQAPPQIAEMPDPVEPTVADQETEPEEAFHADFGPGTLPVSARTGRTRRTKSQARSKEKSGKKNLLWLWIALAVVVLGGGATAAVIFLDTDKPKNVAGQNDKNKDRKKPPVKTRTLEVGKDKVYTTLGAALKDAKPGDRIVVHSTIRERIMISEDDQEQLENVTIESASESVVDWLPPATSKSPLPLLRIADVSGLKVRGFRFDGDKGKVEDLVRLSYSCPGLLLEKLQFKGYKRSAVNFVNCEGTAKRPIVLRQSSVEDKSPKSTAVAIMLEAKDNVPKHPAIRNLHVKDCDLGKRPFSEKPLGKARGNNVSIAGL